MTKISSERTSDDWSFWKTLFQLLCHNDLHVPSSSDTEEPSSVPVFSFSSTLSVCKLSSFSAKCTWIGCSTGIVTFPHWSSKIKRDSQLSWASWSNWCTCYHIMMAKRQYSTGHKKADFKCSVSRWLSTYILEHNKCSFQNAGNKSEFIVKYNHIIISSLHGVSIKKDIMIIAFTVAAVTMFKKISFYDRNKPFLS